MLVRPEIARARRRGERRRPPARTRSPARSSRTRSSAGDAPEGDRRRAATLIADMSTAQARGAAGRERASLRALPADGARLISLPDEGSDIASARSGQSVKIAGDAERRQLEHPRRLVHRVDGGLEAEPRRGQHAAPRHARVLEPDRPGAARAADRDGRSRRAAPSAARAAARRASSSARRAGSSDDTASSSSSASVRATTSWRR